MTTIHYRTLSNDRKTDRPERYYINSSTDRNFCDKLLCLIRNERNFTGLVDCENEDDIRSRVASLKVKWDNLENTYLPKDQRPKFHDYISEKVLCYTNSYNLVMYLG